ncbi:hypothetical protein E8E14_006388 [Neopestalotiopsis sp. 37M]|nr:hypothetical protein E8E14_006388 [Neopestalotiopsis sp. 37M]
MPRPYDQLNLDMSPNEPHEFRHRFISYNTAVRKMMREVNSYINRCVAHLYEKSHRYLLKLAGIIKGQVDLILKDPTAEYRKQLRTLENKVRDYWSEIEVLKSFINKLQQHIQNLDNELAETKNCLQNATLEVADREQEIQNLTNQLTEADEDLDDTNGRLTDLAPLFRDVTPKELSMEYEQLCGTIEQWVENAVGHLFNDPAAANDLLHSIRARPGSAARLCAPLRKYDDLVEAAKCPETSQDIILALIWRVLYENIFSTPFYDAWKGGNLVVEYLAWSMRKLARPERTASYIRNWTNEAYYSMIIHPGFAARRTVLKKQMALKLAGPLRLLMPNATMEAVAESIGNKIIEPAMRLMEKMRSTNNPFYMKLTLYDPKNPPSILQLMHDEPRVVLEDVYDNRVEFDPKMLPPEHDDSFKEVVLKHIIPVCAITPALMESGSDETFFWKRSRQKNRYYHLDLMNDECHCKQRQLYEWKGSQQRDDRHLDQLAPAVIAEILAIDDEERPHVR